MLLDKINKLRPKFVEVTQKLYDEWDQEDDSFGICDLMDSAIASVVVENLGDVDIVEGGHDGDDHAWSIAYNSKEAVSINLPAYVYETGGGYNWKKKLNVKIQPNDFEIEKVDRHLLEAWGGAHNYVSFGFIMPDGSIEIAEKDHNSHGDFAYTLTDKKGATDYLVGKGAIRFAQIGNSSWSISLNKRSIPVLLRTYKDLGIKPNDELVVDVFNKMFAVPMVSEITSGKKLKSFLQQIASNNLVEATSWSKSIPIWEFIGQKKSGFVNNKGKFFIDNKGHAELARDLGMTLEDLVKKGIRVNISAKTMSFELVKNSEKISILMKFIKEAEPDEVYIDLHHDKDLTDFDSFESHDYSQAIRWLRDRRSELLQD